MFITDNRVAVDIEIDKKQVCHYIGYEDDKNLSARISSLIELSPSCWSVVLKWQYSW
jgi:hypothetical protein